MVKRTVHILQDDLDSGPAAETVPFELDGTRYTIDLSAANSAALRAALDPFIRAATAAWQPTPTRGAPARPASGSRPSHTASHPDSRPAGHARDRRAGAAQRQADNAAIRDWARRSGYQVRDLGRISTEVVDAYHRVQAATTALPATS